MSLHSKKRLLAEIVFAVVLISLGITSMIFAYNIMLELDILNWSNNNTSIDSETQQELAKKKENLITELIFGIGFIASGSIWLKRIFLKSKVKQIKNESNMVSKPEPKTKPEPESSLEKKEEPEKKVLKKKDAKKSVFIYIILLPAIYTIILLLTGDLLNFIQDDSEVTQFELHNYVFYLNLPFWALMGSYVWKYKKISSSKEYFEILDHDYIITERLFLDKIRTIGILFTISFFAILISFSLINDQNNSKPSIMVWATFSISYGMLNTVMFSYAKIHDQEKKKHFKLFIASGFCKKSLQNDDLKAKHIATGLQWYSNFFKKTHNRGIKTIDKIGIRILASNSSSSIIEDLINRFESGDEYASINKIAEIMGVEVDELFEDETFIQKLREWIIPLGSLAALGQFIAYLFVSLT